MIPFYASLLCMICIVSAATCANFPAVHDEANELSEEYWTNIELENVDPVNRNNRGVSPNSANAASKAGRGVILGIVLVVCALILAILLFFLEKSRANKKST